MRPGTNIARSASTSPAGVTASRIDRASAWRFCHSSVRASANAGNSTTSGWPRADAAEYAARHVCSASLSCARSVCARPRYTIASIAVLGGARALKPIVRLVEQRAFASAARPRTEQQPAEPERRVAGTSANRRADRMPPIAPRSARSAAACRPAASRRSASTDHLGRARSPRSAGVAPYAGSSFGRLHDLSLRRRGARTEHARTLARRCRRSRNSASARRLGGCRANRGATTERPRQRRPHIAAHATLRRAARGRTARIRVAARSRASGSSARWRTRDEDGRALLEPFDNGSRAPARRAERRGSPACRASPRTVRAFR